MIGQEPEKPVTPVERERIEREARAWGWKRGSALGFAAGIIITLLSLSPVFLQKHRHSQERPPQIMAEEDGGAAGGEQHAEGSKKPASTLAERLGVQEGKEFSVPNGAVPEGSAGISLASLVSEEQASRFQYAIISSGDGGKKEVAVYTGGSYLYVRCAGEAGELDIRKNAAYVVAGDKVVFLSDDKFNPGILVRKCQQKKKGKQAKKAAANPAESAEPGPINLVDAAMKYRHVTIYPNAVRFGSDGPRGYAGFFINFRREGDNVFHRGVNVFDIEGLETPVSAGIFLAQKYGVTGKVSMDFGGHYCYDAKRPSHVYLPIQVGPFKAGVYRFERMKGIDYLDFHSCQEGINCAKLPRPSMETKSADHLESFTK